MPSRSAASAEEISAGDFGEQRSAVLDLVEQKRYVEALAALENSSFGLTKNGRLIIAKGDALYELGRDVEALENYLWYLKLFPESRGKNFCLFDASACLNNRLR